VRTTGNDLNDGATPATAKLTIQNAIDTVTAGGTVNVGPGTFTSITAWRFWDWDPSNDRDFLGDLEQGQFAPVAASEPPPLQQLVEEHEAARRRGPGTLTLVLAGIGAVLALAGISFAMKKRTERRKKAGLKGKARTAASTAASRLPLPAQPGDIEQARRRAAELVGDLSVVGRDGVARAKTTLQDVDVERARLAANDVLHALSEGSRHAPEAVRHAPDAVRHAVERVDRKKLKKRGSLAARASRSAGRAAFGLAVTSAVRAAGRQPQKKQRRGLRPWRS
jgi:hypothetical protein